MKLILIGIVLLLPACAHQMEFKAQLCVSNTINYRNICIPAVIDESVKDLENGKSLGMLFDHGQVFITTIEK